MDLAGELTATTEELVPEGCIAVTSVRGITYIDNEGVFRFDCNWNEDGQMVDLVGLVELIKNEILTSWTRREDAGRDDEDDDGED